RATDVADLAGAHKVVEGAKRLLDRREGIEAMQLVEIEVVGAEAPQAGMDCLGEVMARRAKVVGAGTATEAALRRDENRLAPALDGLAEDFLRQAARIAIRGIEHVDAGLEADVDQALRFGDIACAPGLEEFVAAAECAGAEREGWDHASGGANVAVVQL